MWNPWHGCHKISEGCLNCYVYRRDAQYGKDSTLVAKTRDFALPVRKSRAGVYKLAGPQTVYTCFTSDFFLAEADAWRVEAWQMIRQRVDLHFFIVTKRIQRFQVQLPADWCAGYPNVTIYCTAENQQRAAERLPILLREPIRHKGIICEPLLEAVDLSAYLSREIESVIVGGESGSNGRVCRYEWVLAIQEQCRQAGTAFHFKQTGTHFVKDGRIYTIRRALQQSQAAKAGIDLP